jgi:hypothetical protein
VNLSFGWARSIDVGNGILEQKTLRAWAGIEAFSIDDEACSD